MKFPLQTLVDAALIVGVFAAVGCKKSSDTCDSDKHTVATTDDCEAGCPESGCPESGCPESGCPESGCPESGCPESGCA